MNQAAAEVATIPEKQLPIKLGVTNAVLKKLEGKYSEIPDASTKEGYQAIVSAKRVLTPLRTGVEAERKLQVAAAVDHQRRVNSVASQIVTRIKAIEEPLYAAKQEVDEKKARKKREAEQAEERRVLEIEDKVESIQDLTEGLLNAKLETIEGRLTRARSLEITTEEYMEFVEPASRILGQVIDQLTNAVETAKAQAEQQKQLDAQQAEIKDTQRKVDLQASIGRIRMAPVDMIGKSVADIQVDFDRLSGINVTDSYGELADDADAAINDARDKLQAMITQQQNLDAQQAEIDKQKQEQVDRELEAQRLENEKAEEERLAKEQEEADKQRIEIYAEMKARMPEDIKVRTWIDNILAVEPPEVVDAHLCAILRDGILILSDINKMVYEGTQSPVDEDGDKVE